MNEQGGKSATNTCALLHFDFASRTSCLALFGIGTAAGAGRQTIFCSGSKNTTNLHLSLCERSPHSSMHIVARVLRSRSKSPPLFTGARSRIIFLSGRDRKGRCACVSNTCSYTCSRGREGERGRRSATGSLVVIMQESRHTSFASAIH